mmetsp:Transcript_48884/g.148730  ORF Transcript_48884/g.148730 Transcript_48884/m.148730 type:complete len:133 (-) Transcript_48884:536-934(-)
MPWGHFGHPDAGRPHASFLPPAPPVLLLGQITAAKPFTTLTPQKRFSRCGATRDEEKSQHSGWMPPGLAARSTSGAQGGARHMASSCGTAPTMRRTTKDSVKINPDATYAGLPFILAAPSIQITVSQIPVNS